MNAPGSSADRARSRTRLAIGLWGGSLAWLAHLLAAYAITEFGCVSRLGGLTLFGITGVAWMVLAASALALAAAAAAAVLAIRSRGRLRAEPPTANRDAEYFLARVGLLTNGLFVFIILIETVPIFYYLHDC